MCKAERGQAHCSAKKSYPHQPQFPECLYQPANQAALQDNAQHAQVRVDVANFFRSERMSMPIETSFGEQRKARHEHRKCESESKELPQPWGEVRLAKVSDVIAPVKYRELSWRRCIGCLWLRGRQQEVGREYAGGRKPGCREDGILITELRKITGYAGPDQKSHSERD